MPAAASARATTAKAAQSTSAKRRDAVVAATSCSMVATRAIGWSRSTAQIAWRTAGASAHEPDAEGLEPAGAHRVAKGAVARPLAARPGRRVARREADPVGVVVTRQGELARKGGGLDAGNPTHRRQRVAEEAPGHRLVVE